MPVISGHSYGYRSSVFVYKNLVDGQKIHKSFFWTLTINKKFKNNILIINTNLGGYILDPVWIRSSILFAELSFTSIRGINGFIILDMATC